MNYIYNFDVINFLLNNLFSLIRISKATEEEFEAKFNLEIEKNALLESELDEKDGLKVIVQRLMDEIRGIFLSLIICKIWREKNDSLMFFLFCSFL